MDNQKILNKLKNNAFSKEGKNTYIDMSVLFSGLLIYINRDLFKKEFGLTSLSCIEDPTKFKKATELVLNAVPEFQRSNDKWDSEMQATYVLNCLKGFKSAPITLYTIKDEITNCLILDGLQRLTAFAEFMTKRTMVFDIDGEKVTSAEMLDAIKDQALFNYSYPFEVRILKFNSELEAVQHYIETNKNFTHSDADIERAIAYRNKLLVA